MRKKVNKAGGKIINKIFVPPSGKYYFWSPKYVCKTENTVGCKTKKATSIISYVLFISSIILNLLWIIDGIYMTNTGSGFLSYEALAWVFILGIFFGLLWVLFLIVNYVSKEENIVKTLIISISVAGAFTLFLYFVIIK